MIISEKISEEDDMYQGNFDHYFSVGQQLANFVEIAHKITGSEAPYILDLPSGCGRLMRHLSANYLPQKLWACDISKSAVDFCVTEFGVTGSVACHDDFIYNFLPESFFDIVVCGSLLTHIDEQSGRILLNSLLKKIKGSGILIVTSHGKQFINNVKSSIYNYNVLSDSLLDSYRLKIYGYSPYPNSQNGNYGISVAPYEWFSQVGGIKIVKFIESGWDNHQDVYFIKKIHNP